MNLQVVLERDVNGASAPRRADRDQDIPEALRRRDPAAAERLATRYGERAYRLACRITRNGPDAEDVVQDAFWTVVRKIDTFRGESAFGTWLYRIVANAAYLKLRGGKNRRHEISLDAVLPLFDERGRHAAPVADWSPRVEDPAIRTELRMALAAAIEELRAATRPRMRRSGRRGGSCRSSVRRPLNALPAHSSDAPRDPVHGSGERGGNRAAGRLGRPLRWEHAALLVPDEETLDVKLHWRLRWDDGDALHDEFVLRHDLLARVARFPVAGPAPHTRDAVQPESSISELAADEEAERGVHTPGLE